MNKSEQKWAEMKQKGKLHFIVVDGGLKWGGTVAFFGSFVNQFLTKSWGPISSQTFYEQFVPFLVMCIGFGLAWGALVWNMMAKKFSNTN